MNSDQIVLTGNRTKALLLSVVSLAFVVVGFSMVNSGASYGWFVLLFFSLCLLTFLYMLTPGAIKLTIDNNGIEMKSLFKPMKLTWDDIDEFYVGAIRTGYSSTKMICIRYSASYNKLRRSRQVASALTGMEGALPNHFSKSAEELCELLNQSKARWTQKGPD